MKRYHLNIIIIPLLLASFSCRELYEPETDPMDDVVIVDGLVTDQPGSSVIKLRYYRRFLNVWEHPLPGATVHVSDDQGNIFPFYENNPLKPGHYFPEDSFAGVEGRSYVLHIETYTREVYESDPQILLPALEIDSLYAFRTTREFLLKDNFGNYRRFNIAGNEVFVDMRSDDDIILRYRIEPELLLLYTYNEFIEGPPPSANIYYRWKKFEITDAVTLNIRRFQEGLEEVTSHNLCFLPTGRSYYELESMEAIHRMILILKYYTLNRHGFMFHEEVHKQLTSGNKLFDPVVSQLPVSIRCTSDPGKPVAGFFEVSSLRSETQMLTDRYHDNILEFTRIQDIQNIPDQGSFMNFKPWFWQD